METILLNYLAILILVVSPVYFIWLYLNEKKKPTPVAFIFNAALITMPVLLLSTPSLNTVDSNNKIIDLEYQKHKLEIQIDSLELIKDKQNSYISELQLQYINSIK